MDTYMSDLDDFVKNNAPSGKKSKLYAFAGEIFTLKNLGYSEKDILKFLLEKKRNDCESTDLEQVYPQPCR